MVLVKRVESFPIDESCSVILLIAFIDLPPNLSDLTF